MCLKYFDVDLMFFFPGLQKRPFCFFLSYFTHDNFDSPFINYIGTFNIIFDFPNFKNICRVCLFVLLPMQYSYLHRFNNCFLWAEYNFKNYTKQTTWNVIFENHAVLIKYDKSLLNNLVGFTYRLQRKIIYPWLGKCGKEFLWLSFQISGYQIIDAFNYPIRDSL